MTSLTYLPGSCHKACTRLHPEGNPHMPLDGTYYDLSHTRPVRIPYHRPSVWALRLVTAEVWESRPNGSVPCFTASSPSPATSWFPELAAILLLLVALMASFAEVVRRQKARPAALATRNRFTILTVSRA